MMLQLDVLKSFSKPWSFNEVPPSRFLRSIWETLHSRVVQILLPPKMDAPRASSVFTFMFLAAIVSVYFHSSEAAVSKGSFEDNFDIMWSENHFTTSKDGQIWYLSLDKETGNKFMTLKIRVLVEHALYVMIWLREFELLASKLRFWGCFWSIHCLIGCGFQTKQRYRFGWFSMKLKLVGGDSAGVVTAYYVSVHNIQI